MSLEIIKKIISEEIDKSLKKDAWAGGDNLIKSKQHVPENVDADEENPVVKPENIKLSKKQLREIIKQIIK